MNNFDEFVAIDWSGAEYPVNTKSIAVSIAWQGDEAPHLSDRTWSRSIVADWIESLSQRKKKRTLIGIDCNFGYSEITGMEQFGQTYTAQDLWHAVDNANKDHPNYFAAGYWKHELHRRYFWMEGKRPTGFAMPRRMTEQICGESGFGWPESPFKLIGPKQVGKGGLSGMRMVLDLKRRLKDRVAIWPFEEDTDGAAIVIAEIYPRLFLRRTGHGNAKIRKAENLNNVLEELRSKPYREESGFSDHQADALVSAAGLRLMCGNGKTVPEAIASPPAPRRILEREGWIFGVGA